MEKSKTNIPSEVNFAFKQSLTALAKKKKKKKKKKEEPVICGNSVM
jgi:hypothetical protein